MAEARAAETPERLRYLPWHEALATRWLTDTRSLAHAWLLHGPAGTGKTWLARAAAARLLCESPQGHLACGHCSACRWVMAGNHPDLRLLRPDAVAVAEGQADDAAEGSSGSTKTPSRELRIEQIRAVENWLHTATHRGGYRVVVLYPADALNVVSANAILKVLEEPAPNTLFLLVVDAPDRILPTLVSRCRRLPTGLPAPAQARAWLASHVTASPEALDASLAAVGGAPLAALALLEDDAAAVPAWLMQYAEALAGGRVGAVAAQLVATLEKRQVLSWLLPLQRLLTDLALVSAGLAPRYYPGLADTLAQIARHCRVAGAVEAGRWLQEQRAVAQHPLSARLMVQHTLLQVGRLLMGRRAAP